MRSLALIFAVVSLTALVVAGVGVTSLVLAIQSKHRLVDMYAEFAKGVQALQVSSERRSRELRTAALTGNTLDFGQPGSARWQFRQNLEDLQHLDDLKKGPANEVLVASLHRVSASDQILMTSEDNLMGLVRSRAGESVILQELLKDVQPARDRLDDAMKALQDQTALMIERGRQESDQIDRLASKLLGATVAGALLMIAGLGWRHRRTLRSLATVQVELREALTFQQRLMGIVGHDLLSPLSAVVLDTTMLPLPADPTEAAQVAPFFFASAEAASAPRTSRAF
jgi:hypothetical protein